ncbi:hypothetical protein F5B22DRAFT_594882 [Xylaria bambusicola]|uniref:uncharacterized protein n=1 Tax=Xylaria bambusicola TaxID=326684 RepID=UPI0020080ABD|nr:uncharacterized protein F5B22DRAFT_594882 [Xylaria bambusicola]KAI0521969.1 hypothetical protein F5B22DRAFT_594882 [Xylaria bambusicola]
MRALCLRLTAVHHLTRCLWWIGSLGVSFEPLLAPLFTSLRCFTSGNFIKTKLLRRLVHDTISWWLARYDGGQVGALMDCETIDRYFAIGFIKSIYKDDFVVGILPITYLPNFEMAPTRLAPTAGRIPYPLRRKADSKYLL